MKTFSEFLAMGGYASYVWSAYGLALIVLGWNALAPGRRERALERKLAARPERRSA
jgi:heme exporter protein D